VEAVSTSRLRPGVRTVAFRTALGLGGGAVLIVTFLRLVNVTAVYQRLTHLQVGYVLPCGVAFLAAYVVRAMRWRCLLGSDRLSLGQATAIYQVATFLNWMLPVRGGELAKSLLLRRLNGMPVSQSLATVTLDKTMDLLPAAVLLALLPFLHVNLSRPLWFLLVCAMAVVALAMVLLAFVVWRREATLGMINRLLAKLLNDRARRRVSPFLARFIDTLVAMTRRPRLMLVAAACTAVAVGLDALFCLLAFKAVGVTVALPIVLFGYTFYNLAFILPTPPGQIGSNELVGLLIFAGLFRVNRAGVGAMFLFAHPWTAILMAASGLLSLSMMGLTLKSTWRLARGPAEREGA
jgi:uncharacterized protein (TIRG00374 family)